MLAAFQRPHRRFAAARVLETIVHPSPLPDYAGVQAGFAGDRLLLAWTGSDGQRTLVRAEIDEDDGAVIARGTVDQADPNAYLTGLAADRSASTVFRRSPSTRSRRTCRGTTPP